MARTNDELEEAKQLFHLMASVPSACEKHLAGMYAVTCWAMGDDDPLVEYVLRRARNARARAAAAEGN